jgi:MFS family permease
MDVEAVRQTEQPRGIDVVARLERLPRGALAYAVTGIVGLALFVVFYCNFDINVSFIQTCTAVKAGCTPENAASALRLPVCLYLAGYLVGGLVLAPRSDRFGRRIVMMVGICFALVGSVVTALAGGYAVFVLGRAVTGVAMGTLLAIGNAYIGELAPTKLRANYTSRTFLLCTIGATVGIALGLLFTTTPASFPHGLPFALAGKGFENGWRWLYAIAAFLAALALAAMAKLPESPRWLVEHGRVADADAVVQHLEARARRRGPLPEPGPGVELPPHVAGRAALRELFGDRRYRNRVLLLTVVWFAGYATVFSYSTGSTVVLTSALHFTAPVAGMITAVGGLGFIAQGLFSARFSESLERRYWLPVAAVLTTVGAVLIAELGQHITWAFIGSFIVFFGFNVWVPPTFALSSESFPTRIRSAGFGLVDGLGVSGGAMGVLVIAPVVPHLSPLPALLVVSSFLWVAAALAQFSPRARNRVLEELSP